MRFKDKGVVALNPPKLLASARSHVRKGVEVHLPKVVILFPAHGHERKQNDKTRINDMVELMYTAAWHWNGTIDCFGMSDDQRDKLFTSWWRHAEETGGELQIQAAGEDENLLDTDRYYIHARWASLARPFADYAWWLVQLVPDDHPVMTLEGYDRENAERTDIVIAKKQVSLCQYVMVPGEVTPYTPPGAEELGGSARVAELAESNGSSPPVPVLVSAE